MHLVLPADRINFLNGMNSTFFDQEKERYNVDPEAGLYNELLVEIGCKVFEVNRVMYRDVPIDSYDIAGTNVWDS